MPPYALMSASEVAELLQVSAARVHQLTKEVGFPEPVATLRVGRIWERADIERWMKKTGRTGRK